MNLDKDILFPVDISIEQVREAIIGREDFREVVKTDHTLFVYFLGMGKSPFMI